MQISSEKLPASATLMQVGTKLLSNKFCMVVISGHGVAESVGTFDKLRKTRDALNVIGQLKIEVGFLFNLMEFSETFFILLHLLKLKQ